MQGALVSVQWGWISAQRQKKGQKKTVLLPYQTLETCCDVIGWQPSERTGSERMTSSHRSLTSSYGTLKAWRSVSSLTFIYWSTLEVQTASGPQPNDRSDSPNPKPASLTEGVVIMIWWKTNFNSSELKFSFYSDKNQSAPWIQS